MERRSPRQPGVVPSDTSLILATAPCNVRKCNLLHMVTCGRKNLHEGIQNARKGVPTSPDTTNEYCYHYPFLRTSHLIRHLAAFTDEHGKLTLPEDPDDAVLPVMFGRYRCIREIASGAFSQLIMAEDMYSRAKQHVAIKVLHTQYASIGVQEAFHLRRVQSLDPLGDCRCLPLLNLFYFGGHVCMVFPLLGGTLLTRIRQRFLSVDQLRHVATQLAIALRALQKLDIIHADMKPENILVEETTDGSLSLKLCDFGNAMRSQDSKSYYTTFEVQSMLYRAPEVLMGMPFGKPIDMWSLGCILFECFLGFPPFECVSKDVLLYRMIGTIGAFPRKPFSSGKLYHDFFDEQHELKLKPAHSDVGSSAMKMIEMKADTADSLSEMERYSMSHMLLSRKLRNKDPLFVDFMQGLLCYEPAKRLTPEHALLHPFLSKSFPQGPLGSAGRTFTFRERLLASLEYPPTVSVPMGHPQVKGQFFHSSSPPTSVPKAKQPATQSARQSLDPGNKSPFLSLRTFGSGVPFGNIPPLATPRKAIPVAVAPSPPPNSPLSVGDRPVSRNSSVGKQKSELSKRSQTNPPSLSNRFGWNRAGFGFSSVQRARIPSSDFSPLVHNEDDDSVMMLQETSQVSSSGSGKSSRPASDFVVVAGFGAASARKRKAPSSSPASAAKAAAPASKSRKLAEADASSLPPFDLSGEHG